MSFLFLKANINKAVISGRHGSISGLVKHNCNNVELDLILLTKTKDL